MCIHHKILSEMPATKDFDETVQKLLNWKYKKKQVPVLEEALAKVKFENFVKSTNYSDRIKLIKKRIEIFDRLTDNEEKKLFRKTF